MLEIEYNVRNVERPCVFDFYRREAKIDDEPHREWTESLRDNFSHVSRE